MFLSWALYALNALSCVFAASVPMQPVARALPTPVSTSQAKTLLAKC